MKEYKIKGQFVFPIDVLIKAKSKKSAIKAVEEIWATCGEVTPPKNVGFSIIISQWMTKAEVLDVQI